MKREQLQVYRERALAREWTCAPHIKDAWRGVREAWRAWTEPPPPPPEPRVTRAMVKWAEEVANGIRGDGTDAEYLAEELADFIDAHVDKYGQYED